MAEQKPSEQAEKGKKEKAGEEGKSPAAPKQALPVVPAIILGAAIVAGIACAFVMVKALSPKAEAAQEEKAKEAPEAPAAKKEAQSAKAEKKEKGGKEGKEGAGESPAGLYVLDKPIVVNLAESNAERFLKVSVVFDMDPPGLKAEIEAKQPKLLDLLINILSSKTLDTISTPAGRNILRQEMIDKLNAQLEGGRIVNVYFTEFVVQ